MSQVRTKFTKRIRFIAPSGKDTDNVYQESINKKTGRLELVKTGETNIREKIQQDLESSKIENIIHKLAMGDMSVLKQASLTYVDANDMPQSLMEAQNIVIRAKAEFDNFPKEVRELFHNSPEEYVSQMGTDEYFKKLAPYNDKLAADIKKKETEEYESKVKEQANFNKAVNKAMEE